MKTAAHQGDPKVLGQLLQERLHSKVTQDGLLHIQCAFRHQALLVLGQHAADVVPDPQQTFVTLEQAIWELQPEFISQLLDSRGMEAVVEVKLYLRVTGQKQPYAFHSFTRKPVAFSSARPISESEKMRSVEDIATKEVPPENLDRLMLDPTSSVQPGAEMDTGENSDVVADSTADEQNDSQVDTFTDRFDSLQARDSVSDLTFDSALDREFESDLVLVKPRSPQTWIRAGSHKWSLPSLALGAAVSLFTFLASLYALTRPCVIGSCTKIQSAQQLGQLATQKLQTKTSPQALVEARQQLATANYALRAIPPWSNYHREAQALLQTYQTRSQSLDRIIAAHNKANAAAQSSQNPPHTVPEWEQIQTLWREAIAQLEAVPQQSPVYPLTQQKMQEYQANLAIINQRVMAEQRAAKKLTTAQATAQVAEARQGIAQSLETWQLVDATWQVAVNTLAQIPQGTMAYAQAQQLSELYRSKLATARNRKTQEQLSAQAYNQAVRFAQAAKGFEHQNQWYQAVANWRQALTYTQQVPTGTFYYNQAQPLLEPYTSALEQAEVKLKVAAGLQQARLDLDKTCLGKPRICSYTITDTLIKVRLNPVYLKTIQQTALAAGSRGDYKTLMQVDTHLRTLSAALEAISDNADMPIEVHDPTGAVVGTHSPNY